MYLWWWVSNLLRWQGTVSKAAVFFAFPSPCYLHLNLSLPPAAVSSEANTLSSTPGARVFSLNSCPLELWCPSQRSYGKKGTVNCLSLWWPGYIDVKFCKSPLRAGGRSGIHRYRVSFCTFFFFMSLSFVWHFFLRLSIPGVLKTGLAQKNSFYHLAI